MTDTSPAGPDPEQIKRIRRAVVFMLKWDQGEQLATHEGRVLRYCDVGALIDFYQQHQGAEAGGRATG